MFEGVYIPVHLKTATDFAAVVYLLLSPFFLSP